MHKLRRRCLWRNLRVHPSHSCLPGEHIVTGLRKCAQGQYQAVSHTPLVRTSACADNATMSQSNNEFVGVTCSSSQGKKVQSTVICTASHTVTTYRAAMTTQCLRQWATLPNKSPPFSTPCTVHPHSSHYLCAQGSTVLCWDETVSDLNSCPKMALDRECSFIIADKQLRKSVIFVLADGTLHTASVDKKHSFRNSRVLLEPKSHGTASDTDNQVFAAGVCEGAGTKSVIVYQILRNKDDHYFLRLVAVSVPKRKGNLKAQVILDLALLHDTASVIGDRALLVDACFHSELQHFSILWNDCTWQTLSIAAVVRDFSTSGASSTADANQLVSSHSYHLSWMLSSTDLKDAVELGVLDNDVETQTTSAVQSAIVPVRKRSRKLPTVVSGQVKKIANKRLVRHIVALGASRILFIRDDILHSRSDKQEEEDKANEALLLASNSTNPRNTQHFDMFSIYDVRHGVPLVSSGSNNLGSFVPDLIELVQSVRPSSLRPQCGFTLGPRGSGAGSGSGKKSRTDTSRVLIFPAAAAEGNLSMVQVIDSVASMAALLGSLQWGAQHTSTAPTASAPPTSATLSIEDRTGAEVVVLKGNAAVASAVATLSTIDDAASFQEFVEGQLNLLLKPSTTSTETSGSRRKRSSSLGDGQSPKTSRVHYHNASVLKHRQFILAAVSWCCSLHPEVLSSPKKGTRKGRRKLTDVWSVLSKLVRTGCVSWALCPGLLPVCFSHQRLDLLEDCIVYVGDLPETEVIRILRFVWGKCDDAVVADYASNSSRIISEVSESSTPSAEEQQRAWVFAGVTNFLLLGISVDHSEHFLEDAIGDLSLPEVFFVLQSLLSCLESVNRRKRRASGALIKKPLLETQNFSFRFLKMPSEAQLIDCIGFLLDAHVSSILLAAQASDNAGNEVR